MIIIGLIGVYFLNGSGKSESVKVPNNQTKVAK